jgi:5-(hydroxymethyl)furfural/furfural oxidase
MSWDVVIVGGGSAGCVMAGRLSEDPACRVLLIEAGRDVKPGEEGAAILDMYPGRAAFDPANHWPRLQARFEPVGHNDPARPPARTYEQARLLGGGSSINGQVANRGTPDDYDEWAEAGAAGWAWRDVLPYFIRLENDLGRDGPLHGKAGPIPIHRIPREKWPGFSHAVEQALAGAGFADIDDQNGRFEDGYFPQTLSNDGTSRVSTAMGYLGTVVRKRPNLRIMAERQVRGLLLEGNTVRGVELQGDSGPERIEAGTVVLSAGAIGSPALLLRAGIGPAAALRDLGIPVVADRPGVGANLQEHPGISLSAFLTPHARLHGTTRRHIHLGLRYSSAVPGCSVSDMYMMAAAKSAWHPLGERIGSLLAWINKPYSRGRVVLQAADPMLPPIAEFNHLADPRDAERLVEAVRFMAGLMATAALSSQIEASGPVSYSGFARALGRQTVRNYLLTAPAAKLLDWMPALRAPFFQRFVSRGTTLETLLQDQDGLEAYVRGGVFGQWHPCGTCRIGDPSDRDAVVDPSGRVLGVDGLRVADASVMPVIPRANLNVPTIMLAEKLAAALAQDLGGRARTAASSTSRPQPGPVGSTSSPSSITGAEV